MKTTINTKTFIATCIILASFSAHIDGAMSQYKWMYFKSYGSTVNLEPLFNETDCNIQTQCYWLLPDKLTRLNYPYNSGASSKYSIASTGILTIVNIQSSDNGIYHFFKMNNTEQLVSKAMLNLHGAPFDSLWLEYWPNVVGGLVAMLVVFITSGFCMLADKYRYHSPKALATRRPSHRPGTVEPLNERVIIRRENPAFINDDNSEDTRANDQASRRKSANSNIADTQTEHF